MELALLRGLLEGHNGHKWAGVWRRHYWFHLHVGAGVVVEKWRTCHHCLGDLESPRFCFALESHLRGPCLPPPGNFPRPAGLSHSMPSEGYCNSVKLSNPNPRKAGFASPRTLGSKQGCILCFSFPEAGDSEPAHIRAVTTYFQAMDPLKWSLILLPF